MALGAMKSLDGTTHRFAGPSASTSSSSSSAISLDAHKRTAKCKSLAVLLTKASPFFCS